MNILTFDVAEWFQLPENPTKEDDWLTYEPRLEANAERVLRILDETDTKAIFFCDGLGREASSGDGQNDSGKI